MAEWAMSLIPVILVTMKRFLFLVLASCLMVVAQAQRVYFIYLQSENATPFFVKMSDKVHSSSSAGYLILSNLKDSTYLFTVGFPGGKTAEKRFSVVIDKGDRGFLLKNFEDGLGLFDLQTLGVVKAIAAAEPNPNEQIITRTDPFTRLLSEAADDASLLTTTIALKTEAPKKEPIPETKPDLAVEKKPEPKAEIIAIADSAQKTSTEKTIQDPVKTEATAIKAEPKVDTSLIAAVSVENIKKDESKKEEVKKEEVKSDEVKAETIKPEEIKRDTTAIETVKNLEKVVEPDVQKTEPKTEPASYFKRSIITKRTESSTTEGFGLVYLDHQDGEIDTIRLLIPHPKKAVQEERELIGKESEAQKSTDAAKVVDQVNERKVSAANNEAKDEKKSEKRSLKDLTSGLFKAPRVNPTKPAPVPSFENKACLAQASDKDFLKLRKNMAAETNDEAMIEEAKEFFYSKCFSTEQIKNLSALFLTSAAKYQFFHSALKHVTDPSQFASLESEIKDPHYLKRFKALIEE